MTIEEAIKKAIKGGWKKGTYDFDTARIEIMSKLEGCVRVYIKSSTEYCVYELNETYLDPLFWKCLGKAMGWKRQLPAHSIDPYYIQDGWIFEWHKFIDHLAEGKTAEDFFKSLAK